MTKEALPVRVPDETRSSRRPQRLSPSTVHLFHTMAENKASNSFHRGRIKVSKADYCGVLLLLEDRVNGRRDAGGEGGSGERSHCRTARQHQQHGDGIFSLLPMRNEDLPLFC